MRFQAVIRDNAARLRVKGAIFLFFSLPGAEISLVALEQIRSDAYITATHRSNCPFGPVRSSPMTKIDFTAPAELFPSRNRKTGQRVRYRRFAKAAEAIKFAIEELPEPALLGAVIVLDDARLSHNDIRALYESEEYPLKKAG